MAQDGDRQLPPDIPPPPNYPPPQWAPPPPPGYGQAQPVPMTQVAGYRDKTPRPELALDWELERNRLTTFLRYLLVAPHVIVLGAFAVAYSFVQPIGWVAAVFLGRLPQWAAAFTEGFLTYQTRVLAYLSLLTDTYPPFSWTAPEHPVQTSYTSAAIQRRWHILLRSVCAFPASALLYLVAIGGVVLQLPIWLVSVLLGRTPASLYAFNAAMLRYAFRVTAYLSLVTDRYPFGLFGDKPPSDNPVPPVVRDSALRPQRRVFELGGFSKSLIGISMAFTALAGVVGGVLLAPFASASFLAGVHQATEEDVIAFDRQWQLCLDKYSIPSCIHKDAADLKLTFDTTSLFLRATFGYATERHDMRVLADRVSLSLEALSVTSSNPEAGEAHDAYLSALDRYESSYRAYLDQVESDWGEIDSFND